MEQVNRWEAVMIGGGVAGSAAAIRLAQSGRRVLLLEKEPAAHDKVCGEFIACDGRQYLHELGLDLAALGAVPIAGYTANARLSDGLRKAALSRLQSLSTRAR